MGGSYIFRVILIGVSDGLDLELVSGSFPPAYQKSDTQVPYIK